MIVLWNQASLQKMYYQFDLTADTFEKSHMKKPWPNMFFDDMAVKHGIKQMGQLLP